MEIIQIVKNHKWAFILALLSAIIISLPQIYFRYSNKDAYQGIELMATSDEQAYLSRIKEVEDGHPATANPYFKEGKSAPYVQPSLGPILVVFLGRIFSLDFGNTVTLSRFVFPFLVFLAIYYFVLLISKDKLTALASSTTVLLGSVLLSRFGILKLLAGESPLNTFLIFSRLINPPVSSLFFFCFLIFCWLFLERKQRQWGILAVVVLGLSFYVYPYTWTFLYAFCAVLLIIFFWQKNYEKIKKICFLILGSLVIAIPFFLNFYQAYYHPVFAQLSQRHGLLETHAPTLGFLIPFLLIGFLLFFSRKRPDQYFFCLALVITPVIVLNQQILTGKMLINAHYHWYYHTPLAIIFLLIMFFSWLSQKNQELLKKISVVSIIVLSIYNGILIQNASYAVSEAKALEQQKYGYITQWLNENAKKEEVVFSDFETSELIPIYTSLNVFFHGSAKFYLPTSNQRLLEAVLLSYRLDGIEKSEAEQIFFRDRTMISSAVYGMYYRESAGDYANIPDEIIWDFIRQYQGSFSVPSDEFIKTAWEKYGVNYVVWDTERYPNWNLDKYQFLSEVYQKENVKIYRIL